MKTYNFIEAVNSGKRFKPVDLDDHGWLYTQEDDEDMYVMHDGYKQYMNLEMINAQFELEEKSVTITESKFYEIIEKANCRNSNTTFTCYISLLAKELGF